MTDLTRRAVLTGACVCGVMGLAACASATETPPESDPSGAPSGAPPSEDASGGIALADVPVGGGIVDESTGEALVITQPTEGDVHVLTAVCTHQGCAVAMDGSEIACPCHGSRFDLTGAVTAGPAEQPLASVEFTIDGETITIT